MKAANVESAGSGRLDFLTVACRVELPLLRLQARSFDRFVDPDLVSRLVVVVNECDDGVTASHIRNEVLPLYGACRSKVDILVPSDPLMSPETDGWIRQQSLKLRFSSLSTARACVVLDSKNHFVKPIRIRAFVGDDGTLVSYRAAPRGALIGHLEVAARYYGVDAIQLFERPMPAWTPYALAPQTVAEMIADIETSERATLESFFQALDGTTIEFYLYFCYLTRRSIVDQLYSFRERQSFTLYGTYPSVDIDIEAAAHRIGSGVFSTFGLHRRRYLRNDDRLERAIVELWTACGLFETADEAGTFLADGRAEIQRALRAGGSASALR